jgi:hypothetical protein
LPSPFSLQQHHRRKWWHIAIVFFFFATPSQKRTMAHCCRLLLLKHKEGKTHKKTKKQNTNKREGIYFQILVMPSHFWLPLLPFCFKRFLLASSSSQVEKKKKKKRKKKKCKKGRELSFKLLLCGFTFGSCFCPPTSALLFQTLSPSIFFY